MKKLLFAVAAIVLSLSSVTAQGTKKQKKTIESKAISTPLAEVTALAKPLNDKNAKNVEDKSRGEVYGPDYSDIIVDNFTRYYIDVYVDGSFRMTLAPYAKRTTWAVPGKTKLYAKATFTDGSYSYWGPTTTTTGYEYKWNLRN